MNIKKATYKIIFLLIENLFSSLFILYVKKYIRMSQLEKNIVIMSLSGEKCNITRI